MNPASLMIPTFDEKAELQRHVSEGSEMQSIGAPTQYDEKAELLTHIQQYTLFAGILILENNKTYGRTENKKRLLYKCIPNDKKLPPFLVPYDIKLEFSKHLINKYVVFKYDHWKTEHPRGIIQEVIGNIDKLEAFYEYRLYCKNLHISNKEFTKKTQQLFRPECEDEYIQQIIQKNARFIRYDTTLLGVEGATKGATKGGIQEDKYIFTIDPQNSEDFDDGFSIECSPDTTTITIYIANVFLWLETFQLWQSFAPLKNSSKEGMWENGVCKRVCTIYLPDRRRPMLPTILSDNLCSLLKNKLRFAFCMDVVIDNKTNSILSTDFYNSLIRVNKNFVYEEHALLKNKHYKKLLEMTNKLARMETNKTHENNSRDVVSYWMVFTNKTCAEKLYDKKVGIYRIIDETNQHQKHQRFQDKNSHISSYENDSTISKETKQFIQHWLSICGKYAVFSEDRSNIEHSLLSKEDEICSGELYIHVTSPIRRLVDLLNQMLYLIHYHLCSPSDSAIQFLEECIKDIETINEKMKSSRKVERECEVVRKCLTNPNILETSHDAYIINKSIWRKKNGAPKESDLDEEQISGKIKYKYVLYLEHERIILTMKTEESKELYKKYKVRLYKIESYGIASKIKVVFTPLNI